MDKKVNSIELVGLLALCVPKLWTNEWHNILCEDRRQHTQTIIMITLIWLRANCPQVASWARMLFHLNSLPNASSLSLLLLFLYFLFWQARSLYLSLSLSLIWSDPKSLHLSPISLHSYLRFPLYLAVIAVNRRPMPCWLSLNRSSRWIIKLSFYFCSHWYWLDDFFNANLWNVLI